MRPGFSTLSGPEEARRLLRSAYLICGSEPELRARLAEVLTQEGNGHPHVGGGDGPEAVGAQTRGQAERPNTEGGVTANPTMPRAQVDLYQRVGTAAIPLAQNPPEPETHRVIVGHERLPGGVLRPVHGEHPVGGCDNCRRPRGPPT